MNPRASNYSYLGLETNSAVFERNGFMTFSSRFGDRAFAFRHVSKLFKHNRTPDGFAPCQ